MINSKLIIEFTEFGIFKIFTMVIPSPYNHFTILQLYLLCKGFTHWKCFFIEFQKHSRGKPEIIINHNHNIPFPSTCDFDWSTQVHVKKLQDILTCLIDLRRNCFAFLLTHPSHTLVFANFSLGITQTKSLLTSLFSKEQITYPNLLCYNSATSFYALIQLRFLALKDPKSATYMFISSPSYEDSLTILDNYNRTLI